MSCFGGMKWNTSNLLNSGSKNWECQLLSLPRKSLEGAGEVLGRFQGSQTRGDGTSKALAAPSSYMQLTKMSKYFYQLLLIGWLIDWLCSGIEKITFHLQRKLQKTMFFFHPIEISQQGLSIPNVC